MARHGGNLRELAQRAGRRPEEILDFSASVNPLGPPEGLRPVVARALDDLVHYPDPDCAALVESLARRHGVLPEQIIAGNGSSELLFAAARACSYRRAIVPVPSYMDYATAVRTAGREVHCLPLDEAADFALDWPKLETCLADVDSRESCHSERSEESGVTRGKILRCAQDDSNLKSAGIVQAQLVLLGQPNNPTGRLLDTATLRATAARHPAATFLVDEAFADFVTGYTSLAADLPANVVVLRSLTKFYAIPGLRIGFAVASVERAREIRRQIPPWSVNALAQEVALAVLSDEDYARRTVAAVQHEREQLAASLGSLPGLYVYPSAANYLLVRLNRADLSAPELARRLLEQHGIAIRTFSPEENLDPRFFRLAVRTAEENERLCQALARIFNLARPATGKKKTPALMIQGTSSNAGKSVLTAGLCRVLLQDGLRVAPFKAQNMSLNSFIAQDGGEMGRAQVVQAQACRLEPDVRMNPVLLKPNSDTGCQVIVRGRPVGNMRVGEYVRYKPQAFAVVEECYRSLAAEYDAILLEGAGSPGEVNLKSHDIVNMRMAQLAHAPVLVVGDIDRGGVFASFVGTLEVLAAWERRLVAGWIVNRFRGDASLLGPALDYTLAHTGRPVLGVVPYLPDLNLPQEDSVEFKAGALDQPADKAAPLSIAVIDLPHISNFTDFDALRIEPDVRLQIIRSADELNGPDAVILPGSKNTLADLDYLRRSGLAERIGRLAREGRAEIVGLCGGFQMLGREIADPLAIESGGQSACGLALLDVHTAMAAEKTLCRARARHAPSGLEVTGYEIHHGQTVLASGLPLLVRPDGQVLGAAREDQRVWGTYLHGLFDADPFRRWFLDRLRVRRGLEPMGEIQCRYDLEPALDRLADVVRRSLRMDEIYKLMGLR